MTTRVVSLTALWTLVASLAAGCESNETRYPSVDRLADIEVGLPEAIETALAELGEGIVVEAELESADSRARWDIDVLVGDEVSEVFIDAGSGRVLDVRVEPEDLEDARATAAALADGAVTLAGAAAVAEERTGGIAVEVEVDAEEAEDALVEVVVVTEEGATVVEVSLADGSIGEVETGEPADEEVDAAGDASGDGA